VISVEEICPKVVQAVTVLMTTELKKVEDGCVKAYRVGPMIRVDIDERQLCQ